VSSLGLGAPADLVGRLQAFEGGRECGRRGVDPEVGPVDAAEFAGVRVDVMNFVFGFGMSSSV
jgi:hypothetical protein